MELFPGQPFLLSLILSFGINLFFFFFAALFKTDKVTDLSYSLSFLIITPILLLSGGMNFSMIQIFTAASIMVWSLRLGIYLFYRILSIGKDDRFDEKRNNFLEFLKFWVLQALVVWVVMLPFSLFLTTRPDFSIFAFTFTGFFIFFSGLIIESISDIQKFIFKKNPENKNLWVNRGLWKYSRHPNYFGEILVWWGLFIIVSPGFHGTDWFTVIGPITITFFLLFVSGIPLLEKSADKKYGKNPDYRNYKSKTSILIPLPRGKKN